MPLTCPTLSEMFADFGLKPDASAAPDNPKVVIDPQHSWLNQPPFTPPHQHMERELMNAERVYYSSLGVTPTTGTTMTSSVNTRTERMSRRG